MTVYLILVTALGAALVPGAIMLVLEHRERASDDGREGVRAERG